MAIITGTNGRNTLRGTSQADTIKGLGDIDSLFGLSGNDTIYGGLGNDIIDGGDGNDRLFGEAGNDTVKGGAGIDTIDGGLGADKMSGGLGNDTYIVDNVGDKAIELAGQGTDLVKSSKSLTLGINFENLTLTGTSSISGTGNQLNNVVTGNGSANALAGGLGDDRLNGAGGNDVLEGGLGGDILIGGLGSDTASYRNAASGVFVQLSTVYTNTGDQGEAAGDTFSSIENIIGSNTTVLRSSGPSQSFADYLIGDDGDNVITGLAGRDLLRGEGGADRFVYTAVSDSPRLANQTSVADWIEDFNLNPVTGLAEAQGDKIDLSQLVTGQFVILVNAQNYVGGGTPSVNITGEPGLHQISADVDGDRIADFIINVMGYVTQADIIA